MRKHIAHTSCLVGRAHVGIVEVCNLARHEARRPHCCIPRGKTRKGGGNRATLTHAPAIISRYNADITKSIVVTHPCEVPANYFHFSLDIHKSQARPYIHALRLIALFQYAGTTNMVKQTWSNNPSDLKFRYVLASLALPRRRRHWCSGAKLRTQKPD